MGVWSVEGLQIPRHFSSTLHVNKKHTGSIISEEATSLFTISTSYIPLDSRTNMREVKGKGPAMSDGQEGTGNTGRELWMSKRWVGAELCPYMVSWVGGGELSTGPL